MQLSDIGKAVYADVRQTVNEHEMKMLDGISAEDTQKVIQILGKVRDNLIK